MLPFIIGAVTITATAAYGAYKYFDEDDSLSFNNKKFTFGNTILVGPQQSGKTHLANYLVDNKLLNEYTPTNHEIKIKNFLDTSGNYNDAQFWEDLISDKKNIFYLFDVEKFLNKIPYTNENLEYNKIIINQISFLTEFLQERIQKKTIVIIGTHVDKLDSSAMIQNIIDELKEEIDLGKARLLFGSLLDEENAKILEQDIIKILKEV